MNAPRAGSAPAFLSAAAANPLGGYGGYGAGLGPNLWGSPFGSAFDTTGEHARSVLCVSQQQMHISSE